jgi:hypothetical protein
LLEIPSIYRFAERGPMIVRHTAPTGRAAHDIAKGD